MSEPPIHLLEDLASIGAQRRYVVGGNSDQYLLPEEMINDAWNFCERAERPETYATLTKHQREVIARLKESINRLGDCVEIYDRSNISDLIERDKCWEVMRDRAGEALSAFGRAIPD